MLLTRVGNLEKKNIHLDTLAVDIALRKKGRKKKLVPCLLFCLCKLPLTYHIFCLHKFLCSTAKMPLSRCNNAMW